MNGKKIILHSTGCPRCEMLTQRLIEKEIPFTVNTDVSKMLSLGIADVPCLQIGDTILDFRDAYIWVNQQ